MKRKWMNVYAFEYLALQNYLNEMKEQGWQVCKISNHYIGFEQGEKKGHYQVVVSGKRDDDPNRIGEEAKNQQKLMNEFGYEHVCSFGYFHVYHSNKKQVPAYNEQQELEHIQGVMKKYQSSFSFLFLLLGLISFVGVLLMSEIDFYSILEVIANRKVHLLLLYWILAVCTAYRMEAPVRAFKKNPQLVTESAAIQKRGLSIFLIYFLMIMFVYYVPAMIPTLLVMFILMKLLRKYEKGYMIACLVAGVVCTLSNNILTELMFQTKNNEPMVYGEVFDQKIENNSLWLTTTRYENQHTRVLEVEVKESKVEGLIHSLMEHHYEGLSEEPTYIKNTYVVKKDTSKYVFVETTEDVKWVEKLK